MPVFPTIPIYAVLVAKVLRQTIYVPLQFHIDSKDIDVLVLLNSGAGGNFIHPKLTSTLQSLIALPKPLQAFNIDGTLNKEGTITHIVEVDILVNDRPMTIELMVARIGWSTLILGFPWLQIWNPNVDWKHRTLTWREDSLTVEGNNNISGKIPRTSINFTSEPVNCKGLALSCLMCCLYTPHLLY